MAAFRASFPSLSIHRGAVASGFQVARDSDADRPGQLFPNAVNRWLKVGCVVGGGLMLFWMFRQTCHFIHNLFNRLTAAPTFCGNLFLGPARHPQIEDASVSRFLRVLVHTAEPVAERCRAPSCTPQPPRPDCETEQSDTTCRGKAGCRGNEPRSCRSAKNGRSSPPASRCCRWVGRTRWSAPRRHMMISQVWFRRTALGKPAAYPLPRQSELF